MDSELKKRPHCEMCSECCKNPVMITKPSDIRRWIHQGRFDILKHASPANKEVYGDLNIHIKDSEISDYCPFVRNISFNKYACVIHDTKPKVCKEFYCESAYGIGIKGIPFKTENGWTRKAEQLGYGNTISHRSSES